MATYQELVAEARGDDNLRVKVKMAIAMTSFTITQEAAQVVNHAARAVWAKQALANPDAMVEQIIWLVLAANAAAPLAAIQAATDAQVQTAVDTAVNELFGV